MSTWGIERMGGIVTFFQNLRTRLHLGNLAVKVILGVCLILIIAMGLFTYYDMVTRVKYHLEHQEERAFEISDTVMRSIEYPMLDGEMEDVQAILEKLNRLKDVSVVDLCDTTGTIRYSGFPDSIGRVDDSPVTRGALRTSTLSKGLEMVDGEKVLHHAMPISNEETCFKCHGAEKSILGVLTVGISWAPIDERIAALRNREITLGIVSVVVVGFFLTLFLSKYVTRPLARLTELADEISRGNPGFEFGRLLKCWEAEDCDKHDCPAYGNLDIMCWYVDGTLCKVEPSGRFPDKLDMCRQCNVYKAHVGDEMIQLADSFKHMLYRLRVYEEEMRRSEEKYRSLFEYDPNAIFVLDLETLEILDANARAQEFYGYEKKELIGKSFMDLGPDEYTDGVLSPERKTLTAQSSAYTKIHQLKKDGRTFYVNVYASQVKHTGEHGIIIATTVDITERLAKEAQLIQASKMSTLGEMATGVAHELNQPLTTIQISADFISNLIKGGQEIPYDELSMVSEEMKGQVDRAVRIINHMREFGRKAGIKKEKIDINEPIRGVITILGRQLKVRGIKVMLHLKEDLPPIFGDSYKLEQVFVDLVVNARDAMEEKKKGPDGAGFEGTLTIETFQTDGQVGVTIADTGNGIPEEIREKIFEPFFTTKKVGQGTGLGLSISYGIVKDHNGIIEVESELERGTIFRISFPPCDEAQEKV
jgi:histidine kinase